MRADVLLHGTETGEHLSVTEIELPPHTEGPPLHAHDFDEAFYVLEGELLFQVEDTIVAKRAGELSFAPGNVPHTLANHSDATARYVLVCAPAGLERHWAGEGGPIPEVTVVGPPIPLDVRGRQRIA
ncbi:MAG TPA: cupin domain-containing protein [Solirubrobacter sp.]|nr:cupin domain-containing protein [Solirubrobacter sp.]